MALDSTKQETTAYEWTASNGRGPKDVKMVPDWAQVKPTLTPDFINSLTPAELALLQYEWSIIGRRKQQIPVCDFRVWCILAGRGFGKSRTASEFVKLKAESLPGGSSLIATRTAGDIQKTFVQGPSGIIKTSRPDFMPRYNAKDNAFIFPNGHITWAMSAEQPDQIRGPSVHFSVADEFASWKYAEEAWDNIQMATREGENSQILAISTPRPTDFVKTIITGDDTVITTGSTYENDALDSEAKKYFITRYEGTKKGEQELHATILGDARGKLFDQATIDRYRLPTNATPPREFALKLNKIIVAVDPAVTSGDDADETGIIIAGQDEDKNTVILDDYSIHGTPQDWAVQAVLAYRHYAADKIVIETNNGGEMCELTLKSVDPTVKVERVTASRGKYVRAEPIAALYEQGRVRHYGHLQELETEMIFYQAGQKRSPNRMDALVWAGTALNNIKAGFRFNAAWAE